MQFRKKPVVIEAVRFGHAEYADEVTFSEVPKWLSEAIAEEILSFEFLGEDYWYAVVHTLEGKMYGSPGDWLIRGVEGELYFCKPDIFEKTYEEANDE